MIVHHLGKFSYHLGYKSRDKVINIFHVASHDLQVVTNLSPPSSEAVTGSVFLKKTVPKNVAIYTGKYPCGSLQYRRFPVNIAKLRTLLLKNICKRLLLNTANFSYWMTLRILDKAIKVCHMSLWKSRNFIVPVT